MQWQTPNDNAEAATTARFSLAVVIPVLNEERGLDLLLASLRPELEAITPDWRIIFVDDGSTDATLPRIAALNAQDPRIKAISLSRNFGKEVAVAAGLRYADADVTVLMDADLQHPPAVIHEFIAGWRAGYDVVYGVRNDREADSLLRQLYARLFYRAFGMLSGTRLPKGAGDFRLMSRRAVAALNKFGERARFNKGLYAWIGFKSKGIPFDVPERAAGGGSRWRLRKLASFALDGVASFSTVPLRVSSYLGLAISLVAFAFGAHFVIKTLIYGPDVAGFPTLIVSIMFFAGVQLISLGIIGEYLGRVYEEVKARPLFLVADEVGFESASTLPATADRTGEPSIAPNTTPPPHA